MLYLTKLIRLDVKRCGQKYKE